jgi:hypothetical protein
VTNRDKVENIMQDEKDVQSPEGALDDVFARPEPTESRDSGTETAVPNAGQPRDEMGKFAPKEPLAAESALPTEQPESRPERMIPLPELLGERQKRQEAERKAAEYAAKVEAYERTLQYQQRPPQPQQQIAQQPPPDAFADPEGFAKFREDRQTNQFRNQIANMSESFARRQYGNDVVDQATKWAIDNNVGNYFLMQARDPYGELVDAYKEQQVRQRIGSDPDAYEKKIRDEERKKVLEELKAGSPKPTFPGSLATATQTGTGGGHLSAQAAADSVFARRGG